MVDAELAPRFQRILPLAEFGDGEEAGFGDDALAFAGFFFREPENVDDAEVDFADFVRVVVEQRDDVVRVGCFDEHFLRHLALDGGVVGVAVEGKKALVAVVHVAADAHAAFGDEALFAGFFAANVVEYGVARDDEDVGDDLLEVGVRLGGLARGEEVVFASEERGEIAVHVEAEPLKHAELLDERTAHDHDIFVFHALGVTGGRNFQTKKSNMSAVSADRDAHTFMPTEPTPDEWRDWLRENGPRFLLFARQQTRSESDAEDVLQDALVESWRRAGGMPDDALVYATIRRRAIDLARSSDRRAIREEGSGPEQSWFAPDVEQRETQRLLEEAVKEITPIYRDVVILKMWGDLTFAQIAETLGIPLNTAASRYRYAIEELRGNLKGVLL